MTGVYLDNNATTALDDRVLSAMLPALRSVGNPGSVHAAGREASRAVDQARHAVAEMFWASPGEVVFTSGSTEANNLALFGVCGGPAARSRRRLVTCTTEHSAVLEPARALAGQGFDVVTVPVDHTGLPEEQALLDAIDEHTVLVSLMAVNNETGVQPELRSVIDYAHDRGALVHTDATQLAAWGGVDTDELLVDLASVSAHKMHGPQGVGALFIRREIQKLLYPVSFGGGQERGLRSGTLNVAGIVGFGAAATLAVTEGGASAERTRGLRDRLHRGLSDKVDGVLLNGHRTLRAPGTLNISVPGVDAEAVMVSSLGVSLSTGSACHAGAPGPSHVLAAMGLDEVQLGGSMRLSLSRFTTDEEVTVAIKQLASVIEQVKSRQLVEI